MERPYIGSVEISAAMAEKLAQKHVVTGDEVREACADHDAIARWHEHELHGWRLLVRGKTARGRRLMVILQPVDPEDGTWRLRTAFEQG